MKRIRTLTSWFLALTLGLVIPLAGCGGDDKDGKVTILLTDAPGDFKRAVVTISEIELLGEGENNRVVLMNQKRTTDLLSLANDTATLVQDAIVPAGTYKELRFVITGGYVEVEEAGGGTKIYASSPNYEGLPSGAQVAGDLQMPSYGQSGLKVKLSEAVSIEGEQKVILVDFDVAQSFGHQAGNSGKWVMSPVIKAAELTVSGGVTVTLNLASGVYLPVLDGRQLTLGDFRAVLINAGGSREELALTDANNDGLFEAHFKFLIPGNFTADIAAPEGVSFTTQQARPTPVAVASGKEVSVGFTLTSAQVP